MRLLLDTDVVIWALNRSDKLKNNILAILRDPTNELVVSVISIWEISIKQSLGKLTIPNEYLSILQHQGIRILTVNTTHAYAIRSLPRLHRDPFDRMLIAQAMLEDLTIMTHDKQIPAYSVSCMMV